MTISRNWYEVVLTPLPHRKKNSARAVPAYIECLRQVYREKSSGRGGIPKRLLPESIHAVTARGFELKGFLLGVLVLGIGAIALVGSGKTRQDRSWLVC